MLKLLKHKQNNAGFTLLEVLLSVAIIALIAGLGTPVYQSFQTRNDLDVAANTVAQSLRRAQVLARASDGDTTWGVDVRSGGTTVYKGPSYAARDSTLDELFDVPTSITPSGIGGTVFSKFTGLPQTTGTITLTSNANETRTITINEKGTITY